MDYFEGEASHPSSPQQGKLKLLVIFIHPLDVDNSVQFLLNNLVYFMMAAETYTYHAFLKGTSQMLMGYLATWDIGLFRDFPSYPEASQILLL